MEKNVEENKDFDISKEIPVELLQTGIKVTEKEVLEHNYLAIEVKHNI